MLKNIEFANPEMFLLLLLLPLAWWYWRKKKTNSPFFLLPNSAAKAPRRTWRTRSYVLLPILRGGAFLALVIALARPQSFFRVQNNDNLGIDIMLCMDLSPSMLAKDFDPNRLEVAKNVASDFISKRLFDRFGLVVFSGEAFTQCPSTTDYSVVQNMLSQLECGNLQEGTAIGMGLMTALNRLKDSKLKSKVVILMTDGVNNAGYIAPEKAMEVAQELGIKVYTIGIGTDGNALSPVGRRPDGTYVFDLIPVEIDEALLQKIGATTGGRYFRATNKKELTEIYQQIDMLEKSRIDANRLLRTTDLFGIWVFTAIVLLLIAFLLRYTVLKTVI